MQQLVCMLSDQENSLIFLKFFCYLVKLTVIQYSWNNEVLNWTRTVTTKQSVINHSAHYIPMYLCTKGLTGAPKFQGKVKLCASLKKQPQPVQCALCSPQLTVSNLITRTSDQPFHAHWPVITRCSLCIGTSPQRNHSLFNRDNMSLNRISHKLCYHYVHIV